ncbi:LysE family translocator [Tepidamorphus sp. 3E244]|uniref:LysE family translocator n=1 Tax=Tepidamorphus sp. 3E244 TaxID=3385498 RepID=UPI0038FC4370
MFEAFLAAWLGTVAAQAAPGPNLVAVAAAGLGQGRRAALFVVLGVASGVLVWVTAVAFGLGALISAFPGLLVAMKLLGGGYLLFLSIKALRAAVRGGQGTLKAQSGQMSDIGAWRRGALVVLTNPKAALMWAAVAAFLFGHGLDPLQVLAFAPVGSLSALAVYGAYALLFSSGLATRAYARAARWFEALFGAVFGALGATLLADGVRSLRT